MASIQITNTFVVNTKAKSSEVNQNFTDVVNIIKGDHHNPSVYTNAQPITTSGIAPNAQIADTQLKSQITRSGLVNQSALGQIDQAGIIKPTAIPAIFTNVQIFTSNGTFTVPAGVRYVDVEVVGSGGAGGGSTGGASSSGAGGGGGAGGYTRGVVDLIGVSTVTVTVGVGGTGVSAGNGNNGNTSSFGAYLSASGGSGGLSSSNGGTGGDGAGGTYTGGSGTPGVGASGSTCIAGSGGASFLGGGGKGGTTSGSTGNSSSGQSGRAPGSGGGGGANGSSASSSTGGAGADGICVVRY